jgi:hypothetical protein
VVTGQVSWGKAATAVEAEVVVALKEGPVGQRRGIISLELGHRMVTAHGGDDGMDGKGAALVGAGVDPAAEEEKWVAIRIDNLAQGVEPGCDPIVHPLEGQPREVRA